MSICQPSEPLDDRWSDGWAEILGYLDELEVELASDMRNKSNAQQSA
jgi:hypothetical protein